MILVGVARGVTLGSVVRGVTLGSVGVTLGSVGVARGVTLGSVGVVRGVTLGLEGKGRVVGNFGCCCYVICGLHGAEGTPPLRSDRFP